VSRGEVRARARYSIYSCSSTLYYTQNLPLSRLTTHHAAALKHDPTSVKLPATHMAATYDPSLLEMMAPVMGVPTSAATEMMRNMLAVRWPTSRMSLVRLATSAGIIETSAGTVRRGRVSAGTAKAQTPSSARSRDQLEKDRETGSGRIERPARGGEGGRGRTRARSEAEQHREGDEASCRLAHGQEEEDEGAREEAVRDEDRERAVRVGEPVGDDAAKDGRGVEDRERVQGEVAADAVLERICNREESASRARRGVRERRSVRTVLDAAGGRERQGGVSMTSRRRRGCESV